MRAISPDSLLTSIDLKTPLYFDGCFGWYHSATGDRAAVLCSPPGHEGLWTHKTMHRLAARLANSGVSTLRFDLPGCGDSAAIAPGVMTERAWIASIVEAARRVRALSGAREVVLCGIRLAATLAALAAREAKADGIVLLMPVITGRTWMREAKMLRAAWLGAAGAHVAEDQPSGDFLDLLGFRFGPDACGFIGGVQLAGTSQAPAPRVLVLGSNGREQGELCSTYSTLGASVESDAFPDYQDMMQEPIFSVVPEGTLHRVARWITGIEQLAVTDEDRFAQADCTHVLMFDGGQEQPVMLNDGLFGIYCAPAQHRTGAPALVFANMGATHHVGAGRFAVDFARRLAHLGIASLRLDISGLGDSAAAGVKGSETPIYKQSGTRDVRVGIDWLAATHGHTRSVVFGVSSGSFLGLHAAVDDRRIVGLLLVNLQRFLWREGVMLPRWVMLGLPSDPSAATNAMSIGKSAMDEPGLPEDDPERQRVHAIMATLARRDVPTRLIYGAGDPGLRELVKYFGPHGTLLSSFPPARKVVFDRLDHGLLSVPAREEVARCCESFLLALADASGHLQASAGPGWRCVQAEGVVRRAANSRY
jgi:pimeloyl-ACP methyl ester carboxylesterase